MEKGQKDTVKSTIDFGFKFVILLSIMLSILLFFISDSIASYFFKDNNLEPILKYMCLGLPLVTIPVIYQTIMRAFKAMKYNLIIFDVGTKVIRFFAFIFFVFIGYAFFGAIASYFLGMTFSIIASIYIFRKKLFPAYAQFKRVSIGKELISFSWPLSLTGITFIIVSKTDIILLGYFLTSEDIGIYMPVLVVANLFNFVGVSFEYIFLPVISEYFATDKMKELLSLFKSVSKWMFSIIIPMLIFTTLFSKEIITLLYGEEYSRGYFALIIFAFGIAVRVPTGIAGNILVASGHPKLNLASEVMAGTSNIIFNLILIPKFGIMGAALGTTLSYYIRSIAFLGFVYKVKKLYPFNKDYVKILAVGLITVVTGYGLKVFSLEFIPWILSMVMVGACIVVLYAFILVRMRFLDQNDRVIIQAFEKKFGVNLGFMNKFFSN